MQIGVHLPQIGPQATRETLLEFAPRMEALGYDSLWVSDHVVGPRDHASRYPYHPSGRPGGDAAWTELPFLEPLSTLHFVAAVTQRVRLGTSVLVVPMRNPVLQAKMLATLDVLSGGRLVLGAGAGWLKEEFDALEQPFADRGARLDEYLALIKALWTLDVPTFAGRYYRLDGVVCAPKPLQRPHPPIWIGGNTEAALRRAARIGDAWHAVGASPEEIEAAIPRLRAYAAAAGRDPDGVPVTVRLGLSGRDGFQSALANVRRYRALGVAHLCFGTSIPDPDRAATLYERFISALP